MLPRCRSRLSCLGAPATGKSLNFDSGKRAVATPTAVERKHLETWCFPKNICHQGFTKASISRGGQMTCRAQVCFLLLDQLRLILFWRSKKEREREREINPQSNRAETGRKKPRSSQSRFTGRRTPISIWRRRSERLWWGDWSGLVAANVSSTASTVRAVCNHVTYFVASSPLQRCSHCWFQCNPLTYFHQSK